MKTTKALLAVIVSVAAFSAVRYSGWFAAAAGVPADLRDAVADSSIESLKVSGGDTDVNIPEPTVERQDRYKADALISTVKAGDAVYIEKDLMVLSILNQGEKVKRLLFSGGRVVSSQEDVDVHADPVIGGSILLKAPNCVGETSMPIERVIFSDRVVTLEFGKHSCFQRVGFFFPFKVPFRNVTLADFEKAFGGQCRIIPG